MRRLIQRALAVLALAGLFLSGGAQAQTRSEITAPINPSPRATMYVGNSFFYYNNGMPSYVLHLGQEAPHPEELSGTMVTIGGAGLDWHDLESYLRPNAIGRYSFDKYNHIVFNRRNKFYDSVVMADCSQCPINPQHSSVFREYAKKNAEIARKHDVEPILFMTWAYQDRPEMTEQLAEAYTREGNANKMLVIPAGLSFARVVKERPDLNLYQPDKRHPSLIGTYLAASTVYSALTGRSPEDSTYTAGIDPEVARYLRATAWQVTKEYYGSGNAPSTGTANSSPTR